MYSLCLDLLTFVHSIQREQITVERDPNHKHGITVPKARNECILSALSGGFSFVKYKILTSQTLITAWLFVIYLETEY